MVVPGVVGSFIQTMTMADSRRAGRVPAVAGAICAGASSNWPATRRSPRQPMGASNYTYAEACPSVSAKPIPWLQS